MLYLTSAQYQNTVFDKRGKKIHDNPFRGFFKIQVGRGLSCQEQRTFETKNFDIGRDQFYRGNAEGIYRYLRQQAEG